MRCKWCRSTRVIKRGATVQCKECYRYTTIREAEQKTPAKVLLFDIETLPMEFYGWRLWDQITSPSMIKRDWCVLSYAAKWLFEPENFGDILTSEEALAHDDKRLVEQIWELLDESDVVIAHNGSSFDLPKMNARFVFYGMSPPSAYRQVDTRLTARRAFDFTSNKLDYLGDYLGLGGKIDTEFDLWRGCAEGNPKSLKRMFEYNTRDIYLLEDVYVRLRPWIKHPNMALYVSTDTTSVYCPKCGSKDVRWGGSYMTNAGVFDAFRCNNCGAIGRASKRKSTTKAREVS